MKSVSEQEWRQKADGLAEWRKNRTSPPNLDLYKRIVSMVHVGRSVLDVGCAQMHLLKVLDAKIYYQGIDPFPTNDSPIDVLDTITAEDLVDSDYYFETVFMLAALDNVKNIELALKGLKSVTQENIVILTSIGIKPDKNHTVQVDRQDLVSVLGEPFQEVEISPKLFLFEWSVKK